MLRVVLTAKIIYPSKNQIPQGKNYLLVKTPQNHLKNPLIIQNHQNHQKNRIITISLYHTPYTTSKINPSTFPVQNTPPTGIPSLSSKKPSKPLSKLIHPFSLYHTSYTTSKINPFIFPVQNTHPIGTISLSSKKLSKPLQNFIIQYFPPISTRISTQSFSKYSQQFFTSKLKNPVLITPFHRGFTVLFQIYPFLKIHYENLFQYFFHILQ